MQPPALLPNRTLEQFEDAHGIPIVLMTGKQQPDGTVNILRVRDLPATGIATVLAFLNANQ